VGAKAKGNKENLAVYSHLVHNFDRLCNYAQKPLGFCILRRPMYTNKCSTIGFVQVWWRTKFVFVHKLGFVAAQTRVPRWLYERKITSHML